MMTDQGTGQCLCGATRYEWTGAAKFAIRCFCRDCQKVSGAGHLPQVAVPARDFVVSGPQKTHQGTAASGNGLTFGFCGACGSPLWRRTERAPALVFVTIGTLDDPVNVPPLRDVYLEGQLPWDGPA